MTIEVCTFSLLNIQNLLNHTDFQWNTNQECSNLKIYLSIFQYFIFHIECLYLIHYSLFLQKQMIFKDFTVYIDGDLLLAIIAAIGAAFFFFVYQGITLGRKRRRKRRSMNSNVEGHKNDLEKSSEYWTVEKSETLLPNGKVHYLFYNRNDKTDNTCIQKIFCIML